MKISTHVFLNQQHEDHYKRTIPFSASLGFLFKGFKQWNFSVKVLIHGFLWFFLRFFVQVSGFLCGFLYAGFCCIYKSNQRESAPRSRQRTGCLAVSGHPLLQWMHTLLTITCNVSIQTVGGDCYVKSRPTASPIIRYSRVRGRLLLQEGYSLLLNRWSMSGFLADPQIMRHSFDEPQMLSLKIFRF